MAQVAQAQVLAEVHAAEPLLPEAQVAQAQVLVEPEVEGWVVVALLLA